MTAPVPQSLEVSDLEYLADSKILPCIEMALADCLERRPDDVIGHVLSSLQRRHAEVRPTGSSAPSADLSNSDGVQTSPAALHDENQRLKERLEEVKKLLRHATDDLSALRASSRSAGGAGGAAGAIGDSAGHTSLTMSPSQPFDPTNPLLSVCLDTDSYKLSHWLQYPQGTSSMFSYFESRGGVFPHAIFFGLQYYLMRYLARPITARDVAEAAPFAAAHGLPFNEAGWRTIVERHHGRLPIRVRAVPEGTLVPTSNILLSVESLDADSFWVVSWLETLLVRLWCPTTIATNSFELRRTILAFHKDTSTADPWASSEFAMHDFGARGVSSQETAMIAGAAHLTSFTGSDTIAGVWMANRYYQAEMAGRSIPASEHSTMTMWGQHREEEAYRNMIRAYGGGAVFACVSDSYDIFHAVEKLWGGELREEVENMNAALVVRPDSGDPVEVCARVAELLEQQFGSTTNSKRYRELNKVKIIQGDGVDGKVVKNVLASFRAKGLAASNISFGSGGGLLQKFHRDTMKFAFKCSSAEVDGKAVDVYKEPKTDPGKMSKRGRLDLVVRNGRYETVQIPAGLDAAPGSVMETVFENGVILRTYTFDEVRERVRQSMRSLPDVPLS
eukprot:TRINITY_DN21349_c0_g1_i1.p1 TRINITY_DN21349_c0_g1~~TRINITY_DN21349_c0_g1_i1.p1  ORF type:complete len:618 (+),score=165.89 TRINITY_DN21349_c0_g1_i1:158-2011(+)